MTQCTAKSKQSGQRCKRHATPGSSKCVMHGGKTPKGIASPHYKDGSRSKYFPKHLAENYQAALKDDELLATRSDIALMDTLILDLLPKLDLGESGQSWQLMRRTVDAFELAYGHDDLPTCAAKVREMRDIIDKRIAHYATQDEIQSLVDQRRKLAESERKRLVEMQQIITTEQAMLLVGALLDSVKRNVTDLNAITAIQTDFIRLTHQQDRNRVDAGDDAL